MLHRLDKHIALGLLVITVVFSGANPYALIELGKRYQENRRNANVVDKIYLAKKNRNVVDNFAASPNHAYAAVASTTLQYHADIGPVAGSVTSGYVYASFFNPAGSGKTAVVKRIAVKANAVAAANWVNLTVRRTTTGTGGTLIAAADMPEKNTDSANSIVEIRHTGPTVTLSGVTDSRLLSVTMPGAIGEYHSYRDLTFASGDEKLVLQAGQGIALYQEAAGDVDQRVRLYVEWEEVTSGPSSADSYLFAFPRVENVASANYVYNAFFNPGASGKSAVIRRIWFGSQSCDAAAIYTNNIALRRISAASAGTQITASNVPKKNTSSANSVMEFRHTGVTVTLTGTAEARLGHVTPCGAAGQAAGWVEINFDDNDEKLILQAGEGIALISEATGDVDQHVRMVIEWSEVATGSTPASQGEYIWATNKVASTTAANTTMYSFFNPAASGKTIVVKKIMIIVNATTTATYPSYNIRRVTAASGGTLITNTDLPKKHTGTANSIAEARWCLQACSSAITVTYVGTAASRLLSTTGPGVVGQIIGKREVAFGANERLVLKNGEGIGLYPDGTTGSPAHSVKFLIEWDEESSAPSSAGEYLMDIGPIAGNTGTSYTYATFLNPPASTSTAVIKRIVVRVDAVAAAVYVPMQLRRITSASAGTLIATSDIPLKHSSSTVSKIEVRTTGVTAGYVGTSTDAHIIGVQTPGAAGAGTTPSDSGYVEYIFGVDEDLILRAGEGIGLYHDTAAGDADFRVRLGVEWAEVATASTPAAENEYVITTPPVNGSSTAGFVYSSFYNPVSSGKYYIVKRIGIQSVRTGTLVAPGYIAATVRRISTSSGGRPVDVNSIPMKNTGSATSSAEIRYAALNSSLGPIFIGTASSTRLSSMTSPGAVNQRGYFNNLIPASDELILMPGEGIALYQETSAGDLLMRYRMSVAWKEVATDSSYLTQAAYRFFANNNSTDVGSPLAALNTAASLTSTGSLFRLRALMRVGTSTLVLGKQNFILQFAGKGGGSCTSPSGTPSIYTNVGASTTIAIASNDAARDGFTLTSNANDPTDGGNSIIDQMYVSWYNFSNAVAAVLIGQDGKWDFALKDNNAPASTTYCLRMAKTSSNLFAWGWNDHAQIGLGGNATTTSFVQTVTAVAPLIGNWKMSKGNFFTSYGIRGDGTLWAWGGNTAGNLGQGTASTTEIATLPIQVGSSTQWAAVYPGSTGGSAAIAAVRTNGTLWMWGINGSGQTSQSTTTFPTSVNTPTQVGVLTTWKKAAITSLTTVALKTDGTLWAWGGDSFGVLGQGLGGNATSSATTTILQVGVGTTWATIDGGNNLIVALKTDGTLWAWGANASGQLGQGGATTTHINTPTQIGTDTDWVDVAAGSTFGIARKSNGTLWAWGDNTFGQMGNGVASSTNPQTSPVQVGSATDWIAMRPNGAFVMALKSDNTLWAWGSNGYGVQAGNVTLGGNVTTPTQIGTSKSWTQLGTGFRHVLALQEATSSLDSYLQYPEITTYGTAGQTLSFTLSTSTIYFGQLSSASTRYASSTNISGDSSEVQAHTFAVNTNATTGYTVTVRGQTLTSAQNSANTILALGNTNTSPSIGNEQFGIRMTATGGSGAVTVPYAASGFAYNATATTTSQVASAVTGDSATTTYSVRYMSNISPTTEAGSYNASIVYVVTANF